MTPETFAKIVRLKTRTNSTTFTDADMLLFMEARQLELAQDIMKADEDILSIPQTADLVASSITAREYPFPSDILSRIKRVEAQLDGTNWRLLDEIDLGEIDVPISTEANITNQFTNNQGDCFYDLKRKALFIYSGTITATTDGLKLWCDTSPSVHANVTDDTTDMSIDPSATSHGMPLPTHEIWARGVGIDYKQSREKPIPLNEKELRYEFDKQEVIASLKHGNLDREVIGHLPPPSDRGNDGQDY